VNAASSSLLTFNRNTTMNRTRLLGSLGVLGIISCSVVSAMAVGTATARADDWPASNDRPAWNQRCDRDWDNEYCNPKTKANRSDRWDDSQDWRQVQDRWGQQTQDPDRWWNRDQNRWETRDEDRRSDQSRFFRNRLSAGTYIRAYPERRRRIVLRRFERYPLTLIVDRDGATFRTGRTLFPRNSRIEGELVPARGGYRFESDRIRFPNGRSERIWAVSDIIGLDNAYDRDDRSEANISNGAAGILNAILGRSSSSNSVILGDIFNRYPNSRRDLVVLYPDRTLDLRLTRDFVADWRGF
jgi:hypothetical protein